MFKNLSCKQIIPSNIPDYQKDYILLHLRKDMGNEEAIIARLDILGREINFIKEHIIDVTLTQEDINSLNEAEEDLREGKSKRL